MAFALNPIWGVVYRKLEEQLPEQAMREWVDHFQLIKLNQRKAVVLLVGNGDLEAFRSQYEEVFSQCLYDILGYEVKLVFKQKKIRVKKRRGTVRRLGLLVLSLFLLCAAGGAAVLGASYVSNLTFRETFYQVSSSKVGDSLRIIQLSDLHSTAFGGDNSELIRRIGLLQPDLVVMTGDCVEQDDPNYEVTLALCRALVDVAPVYYIYGNDEETRAYGIDMTLTAIDQLLGGEEGNRDAEGFRTLNDPLREALEAAGVRVLLNESETVEIRGTQVDIYGVLTANPSAFWPYAEESYGDFREENPGHFKLLLCHEPYIFEQFQGESWADLTLCGHTHGGVIRIPALGGLYEREHGLLPEKLSRAYLYGLYDVGGSPLIVSSGLTNRGMVRVNNRPELVIVDVSRY